MYLERIFYCLSYKAHQWLQKLLLMSIWIKEAMVLEWNKGPTAGKGITKPLKIWFHAYLEARDAIIKPLSTHWCIIILDFYTRPFFLTRAFSLLLKQNVLINRHKMNFMNLLTIVFAHTHPSSVSSSEVHCKHNIHVYGGYISTSSWFSHVESKHNRVTSMLYVWYM